MNRTLLLGLLVVFCMSLYAQQPQSDINWTEVVLSPPEVEKAKAEDARSGLVPRFAIPIQQSIYTEDHGTWIATDKGYSWHCALYAPGAKALIITTSELPLIPGAVLTVKDERGRIVESIAYRDLRGKAFFTLGPVAGERCFLQYDTPGTPVGFSFNRIYYAFDQDYRPDLEAAGRSRGLGFDASLPCNVNVACVNDADIHLVAKSAVRIMCVFQEGISWCTGALVNNTKQDKIPYILSAFHCQYGYTPLYQFWAYHFRYEGTTCTNPTEEPSFLKVSGSQLRAKWADSDFLLLEMDESPPEAWESHYAGWNRTDNYTPSLAFMVHHPSADIKKVSVDSQAITIWQTPVNWSNGIKTPALHHYRVYLDLGTSEPGSSGAPFFDPQGKIIGQLNGGAASCTSNALWYGRFHRSWTGGGTSATRLRDWLDPDNTGVSTLNGLQNIKTTVDLAGSIVTPVGFPVPNVEVTLTGPGGVSTTVTDVDGHYLFSQVPVGEEYSISASRDGDDAFGVSIGDIILLNKYIVGINALPTPYASIAGDVNNSGSISVGDIGILRKLLLDLIKSFSNVPSWVFFTNTSLPPYDSAWSIPYLDEANSQLNFIAVKYGDVNHSAKP
ncbi:MAG: carboxypeptidase regulatory-like domain-containing protein [Saprospiraceae bacterium]|nr:carboxypeptidase regulatory-like domain-containing protein [Saprospiraceae bacterium]